MYGVLHPEPVARRQDIDERADAPTRPTYYPAQGNATRLFFRGRGRRCPSGWTVAHADAFSTFAYLLSGGYSRRPFYPARLYPTLAKVDGALSRMPRVFGGRCLVELRPY